MDIAKTLSEGQSRAKTQSIVDYIGGDPARFAELVRVFERGDRRMRQCSAWPMSVVAEKHPELLVPHLGSGTTETRMAMADLAIANVVAVLSGRPPLTPVSS